MNDIKTDTKSTTPTETSQSSETARETRFGSFDRSSEQRSLAQQQESSESRFGPQPEKDGAAMVPRDSGGKDEPPSNEQKNPLDTTFREDGQPMMSPSEKDQARKELKQQQPEDPKK